MTYSTTLLLHQGRSNIVLLFRNYLEDGASHNLCSKDAILNFQNYRTVTLRNFLFHLLYTLTALLLASLYVAYALTLTKYFFPLLRLFALDCELFFVVSLLMYCLLEIFLSLKSVILICLQLSLPSSMLLKSSFLPCSWRSVF